MDSANQLDLLKERIEYDSLIFGKEVAYHEYINNEDILYVIGTPVADDMTYIYDNDLMVKNDIITSVDDENNTITVNGVVYTSSDNTINICETYIKVLKRLLEDSKYIALSLRFPYRDYSTIELPKKYNNWQIRCCIEIYQGIGSEGIKSYSENGLSWTRDSGYISYELRSEIEPMVGYIQEQVEEIEDVQAGE